MAVWIALLAVFLALGAAALARRSAAKPAKPVKGDGGGAETSLLTTSATEGSGRTDSKDAGADGSDGGADGGGDGGGGD